MKIQTKIMVLKIKNTMVNLKPQLSVIIKKIYLN